MEGVTISEPAQGMLTGTKFKIALRAIGGCGRPGESGCAGEASRRRVWSMLRRWVVLGVLVALAAGVACENPPPPTPPPSTPSPGPVSDPLEVEALRQLAFAYWEAFNAYDVDRVLGYLEEGYREQRGEEIRDEIGMIELFNVTLGVSEETPPWTVSDDEKELYLTMKEPLGTRRIRMAFRDVAGEWKIIFAEEAR